MFKYYIAIEEQPLKRLARVSYELCDNIDKSDGARYLRRVIEETLETVMDSQSSIADVMASRLFIPAFHFNELLLKPWSDMEDALRHMQGKPAMDPFKQNFCKSAKLIQWALEGKKVVDGDGRMVWDTREKVWRAANENALRDYKWRYEGGTSIPLYYIPIEFLPN